MRLCITGAAGGVSAVFVGEVEAVGPAGWGRVFGLEGGGIGKTKWEREGYCNGEMGFCKDLKIFHSGMEKTKHPVSSTWWAGGLLLTTPSRRVLLI